MKTKLFAAMLFLAVTSHGAVADEPTPTPPADPEQPKPPDATPEAPKAEEPTPEAPKPEAPKPEEPKGVNIPSTPAPTSESGSGGAHAFDDLGSTSVSASSTSTHRGTKPKIAVELALASGQLADPFIQYKGWSFENGLAKGMRLEGNLGGIMAAYELTSMSNDELCIANGDCLTGKFGSTTMHSVELGYRYRMNKILMLRPFIAASLGGVIGDAGDWGMTSGSFKGGLARAVAGVELPIAGKVFGSASIGYRFMIVENPYHSKELETLQTAFVNAGKSTAADYAEDLHAIALYLGVGLSL